MTVQSIRHDIHRGEFWKPCPGTTGGYLCCGYQILTPVTGCGMHCDYCVLQAYFEEQGQVVFDNFDDLEREVRGKMARWNGVVRFGTGEFADSLFLEPSLGVSSRIAAMLEPWPNALVEFKTKSVNVSTLSTIRAPGRVVVGFSMNTPRMVEAFERGTAPLERRLAAARACVDRGFRVAFHFDPMFFYDGCEQEYRGVARMILDAVPDVSRIAWWSMGAFRTMPSLKKKLAHGTAARLFGGEMITGVDGKLRYLRPIRTRLYCAVREEIEQSAPDVTLYLCMESPEVWEDAGMAGRIPDGLPAYLDRRAEKMLGMKREE